MNRKTQKIDSPSSLDGVMGQGSNLSKEFSLVNNVEFDFIVNLYSITLLKLIFRPKEQNTRNVWVFCS